MRTGRERTYLEWATSQKTEMRKLVKRKRTFQHSLACFNALNQSIEDQHTWATAPHSAGSRLQRLMPRPKGRWGQFLKVPHAVFRR